MGTVVAAVYARMNPPTIGHERLINHLKTIPAHDRWIYLSPSHDNKNNPLNHERRVELAKAAFYNDQVIISSMKHKDLFAMLHHLNRGLGYSDLRLVVGSDRVAELEKRIPMYNGTELYNFNSIKVLSIPRTLDGPIAETISSTNMRGAAILGDYNYFLSGLPSKLKAMAPAIFEEVRNACLSKALENT